MQIMFVDPMLGMADPADVNELAESFLKPCGGPASSKRSHLSRLDGPWAWRSGREPFKRISVDRKGWSIACQTITRTCVSI